MEIQFIDQDINDLMVTALEGGINYWCKAIKVIGFPKNVNDVQASDVISLGGVLELYDLNSTDTWTLDREKFIIGLKKTLEWGEFTDVSDLMDNHDAETADVLIQFALFDEILFG